jgi:hypothetical protein
MATQNIFDLTDTWNNVATTFTAIKMNATDTASAAGSMLIDLQVGGGSKFSVSKSAAAQFLSANLVLGAADAAAPVAQTLSVQSVVAGTSNTAGANWTFTASKGTGTGAGGAFLFAGAVPGSSGSTQNAASTQAQLSYYSAIGQYGFYVGSAGAQNAGDIGVYNATRNGVAGLTIRNANAGASAQTYLTFGNSAAAQSSSIILNGGNFSGGLGANGLAIVSAATLALYYGGTTTAAVSIPVTSGVVAFGGAIRALTTTVGALPAAATAAVGARAFVTDALTPVFGSAVAGGGAVAVPVYSTGAAWNVG